MRVLTGDRYSSLLETCPQTRSSVHVRNEYRHVPELDPSARIFHDIAKQLARRIESTQR